MTPDESIDITRGIIPKLDPFWEEDREDKESFSNQPTIHKWIFFPAFQLIYCTPGLMHFSQVSQNYQTNRGEGAPCTISAQLWKKRPKRQPGGKQTKRSVERQKSIALGQQGQEESTDW